MPIAFFRFAGTRARGAWPRSSGWRQERTYNAHASRNQASRCSHSAVLSNRFHILPFACLAMNTLTSIFAAAIAGGVLSTIAAAGTLALHSGWISRLVSFAVGALLGAVFLELLPHALEEGSAERVMVTVLVGLLAFFLLEKLVLWRHAHGHEEHHPDQEESEHDHALHARVHSDHG